ncbi:Sporulation protein YlmC, PRC-barrel domain family [Methylobacterium sp. UNC378MF]|uniref:PRC-barrel domain-containing protein n=1 Tax=Methylobacterium sp. UNC378MF TaxID=1502748 RepID=UPI00087F0ACF|nr:PRC-barrel domain-containing protein [Methylobacterium sp. UNC378MF]SDA29213.1 Sporulation protein YlmC, PRC-barrel domain family [Methylobacterium sp. UNC378MF]
MRGALLKARMLGVLLVTAALPAAASPSAQSDAPAARFIEGPEPGTISASQMIGVPVIGMDHVGVGKIEDVLVDGGGQVRAVIIGVGGFLGLGEKSVALPFDQIAWNFSDVSLTSGPSSIVTPETAPGAEAAARAGPDTMPGARTTRDTLGAVQNQHSGRVTEATGSVAAERPSGTPATVLVGEKPWRAEVRLTRAQLEAAPAFRSGKSRL